MNNPFTKQANGLWKDNPEIRQQYSPEVLRKAESIIRQSNGDTLMQQLNEDVLDSSEPLKQRLHATWTPRLKAILTALSLKNELPTKGQINRDYAAERINPFLSDSTLSENDKQRYLGEAKDWEEDGPISVLQDKLAENAALSRQVQKYISKKPVDWTQESAALQEIAESYGGHRAYNKVLEA